MAEEIHAELAANVWKVEVGEGDRVEEGDTLVILESMKMELPVIATASGLVKTLGVSEGQAVQEGDLIVIID